ncbi:MAG: ATP-binding protein [Treponema sp.]|jgi:hypothetical protein|nr:ATP-binding protein [Treponema sp.]
MTPRKLPIGIQDFENIRNEGYVYVDKTAYIYQMASQGKPFFLSRPRRFGKSLLVSTLKAYFEGETDLFDGLAIAGLEKEWKKHPVLHLDLTGESYQSMDNLEAGLGANLRLLEAVWGKDTAETTPAARFRGIIHRAYEQTGNQVVVLIDEYDKPLTDTLGDPVLHEKIREALQGFYSVLKAADQWLRFVFLTGVTKFSKVSIFSTLNQLRDISMSADYAGICGITESELTAYFHPELESMAERLGMSYEEVLAEMRKRYNGYHFSKENASLGEGVYNPFSALNAFADRDFSNYWFKTGTPTFLAQALKTAGVELNLLSEGMIVSEESLTDYRADRSNAIPLLYQSGYLTIKGYNRKTGLYTLGFPNEEVEHGFLNELLPLYSPWVKGDQGFFIYQFIDDLQKGDVDAFMNRLKAFFAEIPYELNDKTERHYQTLFYLVFRLMGQFAQAEVRSGAGRADTVVITDTTVYVFEFKLSGNGTVDDALNQIDNKGYLIPYSASGRKLVKVGVVFDSATRTLGEWRSISLH